MGKEKYMKDLANRLKNEQQKLSKALTNLATVKSSGTKEAIVVAEEQYNVSY